MPGNFYGGEVPKKGDGGYHGMGGCNLSFAKPLMLSNFNKGFFVVRQGRRVFLCHHRTAGFFCAATRQHKRFFCSATEQQSFLCCHGDVLFFLCVATGLQGYVSCHRVVSCCGACCALDSACFLLWVKCNNSEYPS